LNPIDPKLGALQNNGGQTDTRALLADSTAINAGYNANSPGSADQRGFTRIVGGTIDIGAYESNILPCSYSISEPYYGLQIGESFFGIKTFTVAAQPGCKWSVSGGANWAVVSGGQNITGNGTFNLTLTANNTLRRRTLVTIGGQNFTVTQFDGCTYNIPQYQTVSASGAGLNIGTASAFGCRFYVYGVEYPYGNTENWLYPGTSPNIGPQRSGTLFIKTFTDSFDGMEIQPIIRTYVTQASGCTYTPSTTIAVIPATQTNGSFIISA
jgi:hypothetical protein